MTNWTGPSHLDRSPALRADSSVDDLWRHARVIEIDERGNIASRDGHARFVAEAGRRKPSDILLGTYLGEPWFARPVFEIDGETLGWRNVDPTEAEPLATAVALSRWHLQSPPCERCGDATKPDLAGARRVCVGCGHWAFPRTDPCVIVAITDAADRLLLARQASWAPQRHSIIAGFIEAGESAEQAVHREVGEEVGLTLTRLAYVSSQPWPMPRSLMLGFEARCAEPSVEVDGLEIAEASFFTRQELTAAVDDGSVILPPPASIAHGLIHRWRASGD